MFFLLYKHAVFDDFPRISDHFPKISEDFPKLFRRLEDHRVECLDLINYSLPVTRQIWIFACHEMPWIREEMLQIGALGLIRLVVLTSTSYNFNFHAPLFEKGGCIVNLSL